MIKVPVQPLMQSPFYTGDDRHEATAIACIAAAAETFELYRILSARKKSEIGFLCHP